MFLDDDGDAILLVREIHNDYLEQEKKKGRVIGEINPRTGKPDPAMNEWDDLSFGYRYGECYNDDSVAPTNSILRDYDELSDDGRAFGRLFVERIPQYLKKVGFVVYRVS